jgi:hypothetical protein
MTNRDRQASGIDWPLASALAAEALPAWARALLGRHIASFAPGEARWWPNRFDGVHLFVGPPPTALGDWSGRWRRGERWGRDLVALVAAARGCRPGQAVAYVCRAAGAPFEALAADRRRAA